MGIGKTVKSLFWQSGSDDEEAPTGEEPELSDEEFAALLADSPHAVPPDAVEPVAAESVNLSTDASGGVAIDFQAQYDAAGIPDTDEVEQLENFLERLDQQLPHASKIAAAEAFLGAIGKDSNAVLADAERKIKRVHGILQSKQQQTQQHLQAEQTTIDELQAKIDHHRGQMEAANHELEGVRKACLIEESRLQAARVFFGTVKAPTG